MNLGNQNITKAYLGTQEVQTCYLGATKVYADWTPANTSTSIWLDASDTTKITHTLNVVSAFADKSGKNIVLDATAEANKPLTNVRTINGLNVLDFKTSDFLKSQVNLATPANGQMSIFCVGDFDGPVSTINKGGFWGLRNFAGTSRLSILPYNLTQNDSWIIYQSSGGTWGSAFASPPFNDTAIFQVNYNATTGLFQKYVNGNFNSTTLITEPWTPLMMDQIWIGKNTFDNVGSMPMGFAEMVIVNSIDPTIREKTEGYLAHKWGLTSFLPIAHPYKINKPKI